MTSRFEAQLHRPASPGSDDSWAFVLIPKAASDTLPRRGRTTVEGAINDHAFQATLEPDGRRSHWLKLNNALQKPPGSVSAIVSRSNSLPSTRNPNRKCPLTLTKPFRALRTPNKFGMQPPPSHDWIGSTGWNRPSNRRPGRSESVMPATCLPAVKSAYAASILPDFTARPLARPNPRTRTDTQTFESCILITSSLPCRLERKERPVPFLVSFWE